MSNHQHIFNRLRQAGLTEAAALGFLGNWQQESGCEPNRLQNDLDPFRIVSRDYTARVESRAISRQEFGRDQKGYGLAQWTYVNEARTAGRKFDLFDFWQQTGGHMDDIDTPLLCSLFPWAPQISVRDSHPQQGLRTQAECLSWVFASTQAESRN